ncbi:unnamed protein product [Menidia menidia]|uniref:(Atlantic silverside) hypothetical protein n=1 Tax=Menidia menidia TaxID=238744 RepID=A0A8S4BUK9_9TELE|nr:unnamed protein product [Menidia menidia]
MPPLNRDYTSHCGCLQLESRVIPPASLRSLRLLPHGPHCAHTEVISVDDILGDEDIYEYGFPKGNPGQTGVV